MRFEQLRSSRETSEQMEWNKRYILANRWKSELDLYLMELRHLHHIVHCYSLWNTKEKIQPLLKELKTGVYQTRNSCEELLDQLEGHLMKIGQYIETGRPTDEDPYADYHAVLERRISIGAQDYRQFRKKLFLITENILENGISSQTPQGLSIL